MYDIKAIFRQYCGGGSADICNKLQIKINLIFEFLEYKEKGKVCTMNHDVHKPLFYFE